MRKAVNTKQNQKSTRSVKGKKSGRVTSQSKTKGTAEKSVSKQVKGGHARAKALSEKRRTAIARKGANTRWRKGK